MDSIDRVQSPMSVASSDAVSSKAVELKKEGDDLKTIEAPVSPSSANNVTVTDVQRKIRRAERFGVSVQLSEEERRNSRAERQLLHLKGTAQRSTRTFCSMRTKPRCVPPHKLPVAASTNLAATKRKLHKPHIWIHLPEHKPT